jgi:hypothetical protein
MKHPAVRVFLLCLVVFLANGRPHPEVDCVAAPYTAWSLVRHGSYDLRGYGELERHVGAGGIIREGLAGAWVSMRPPGSALAAVPFVAPFAAFREQPLRDRDMHHLGKLVAAVSVAAAAVFFFLTCRRLAPAAAWPATVLFALGTCLNSVASQALWMHGPAVCWLCCALYVLTCRDSDRVGWGLAAGLALGLAVLTRPTTAFFALATGGALLVQRRWRGLLGLALGGVVPAALLLHYNWVNFGHPFLGGYENDNWAESPPLWLGLSGLLLAPSRGALVYSPALLLALPGAWILLRRREERDATRGLLVAWLAAAGVTLLFFARWHDWRGGWCFGPRFLCETMPVFCLLFAVAYAALRNNWRRRASLGLVALSVSVHVVGTLGYSGYEAWHLRHAFPDQGRCLFKLKDTQIEAHARALIKKLTAGGKGVH